VAQAPHPSLTRSPVSPRTVRQRPTARAGRRARSVTPVLDPGANGPGSCLRSSAPQRAMGADDPECTAGDTTLGTLRSMGRAIVRSRLHGPNDEGGRERLLPPTLLLARALR